MRPLLVLFTATSKFSEKTLGFSNYLARRNKLSFQVDVKWNRPEKCKVYHPENSGDLEGMPEYEASALYGDFIKSKEIENADPKVRKIFSLNYQIPRERLLCYKKGLAEKVKNHQYDFRSTEFKVAWLTGTLRSLVKKIEEAKNRRIRLKWTRMYSRKLSERQYYLELLREQDYKKFEWLLDQLNIVYKSRIPSEEMERTRKKSLIKLVQVKQEKIKEENLAKMREALDQQKIPFLEEKIKKLKWIKEIEEKNNFPNTVSEADIEACMKRLEDVKIEVEKNKQNGYKRKIHPYTVEPYFEKLLKQKEKEGELIREPETDSEAAEAK